MSFDSSILWNYFNLIKKKNRKNYAMIIMQKFKELSAMNQEDYQLYNKLCMLRNNLQEKCCNYSFSLQISELYILFSSTNFIKFT